ncbi:Excreted virulence factor EspC, type VII ESX diderm [Haloechinothrix alba]|uniref:Excreted virulence factor EspC, type VII ESX diderm n=1 Tax=Haloechinothrix alba TaxID=664784 RepID=A0A238XJS8_9PSEU|nr:Excreted virulence factor EspC, type VII ESX diderm [Haloechinothrix alba]
MVDISVSIDGLDRLGTDLDRVVADIEDAASRLSQHGGGFMGTGDRALGPEELNAAATEFWSDWDDGLYKINKALDGVREGLEDAKDTYAEFEREIASALDEAAEGLG